MSFFSFWGNNQAKLGHFGGDEHVHVTRTQSDYKQKCEELFSEYEELKSHEIELEIMLHERSGRGEI